MNRNSYKQSLYTGVIRIVANVSMLGVAFLSMYQAARGPWPAEIGFCIWFFGLTVPLWASAFCLTRFVRKRFPAQCESLVELPGQGRQLVRWEVRESDHTGIPAR
jgi:hypothetical protein